MKLRMVGFLLICTLLLNVGVFATGSTQFNVSKKAVYSIVEGADKASADADYTFTAEAENENVRLTDVYAEVDYPMPKNKNTGEGYTTETKLLAARADDNYAPAITMVEDNDSPMRDVLAYKRIITDETTSGTNSLLSKNIDSCIKDKKDTISLGFWIKESDVTTVFGSKPLVIWPIYNTDTKAYIQIELPLQSLINGQGVSQAITPKGSSIEKIFTGYSFSASCLERDNGWAYIVFNMEDLVYSSDLNTGYSYFYFIFDNVLSVLNQQDADNKIEMSNLTFITGETIKSGYIVYPETDNASSFKAAVRLTEGSTYALPKQVIMGDVTLVALSDIILSEDYTPEMKIRIENENMYVRTNFDSDYDFLQTVTGIDADGINSSGNIVNEPFDFARAGLVEKSKEDMNTFDKILTNGSDEATPFYYNGSYIGANHGHASGILVETQEAHGKDASDIGSLWKAVYTSNDKEVTDYFTLLRVVNANKLLFVSDTDPAKEKTYNQTYRHKNSFTTTIQGGKLTYHSHGQHQDDIIVAKQTASQQIWPANKKIQNSVYTVIEGERYEPLHNRTIGCDYVELVEKYQIMNPMLIGDTLRANRPDGGYTEAPDLAVGMPMVEYNMTYRFMPDGTVLHIFDHKILEDVIFDRYGGLQYGMVLDAFGGGVGRYIPKLKPITVAGRTYDFTNPYNVSADASYFAGAGNSKDVTPDLWESANDVPSRQVDYFYDAEKNSKVSLSSGFLPVLDGAFDVRPLKTGRSVYLYNSKKTYPYFVDKLAFDGGTAKDQTIKGVAYKKYSPATDKDASVYTIPYENNVYIYADIHEIGTKEFELSDSLKSDVKFTELEKSQNVSYTLEDGKLTAQLASGDYGYVVLLAKKNDIEISELNKNIEGRAVTAKIKNNVDSEQNVIVVVAGYNGEILTDVNLYDNIKISGLKTYDFESTLEESFDKVKLFVWENYSTLKPLCSAKAE